MYLISSSAFILFAFILKSREKRMKIIWKEEEIFDKEFII